MGKPTTVTDPPDNSHSHSPVPPPVTSVSRIHVGPPPGNFHEKGRFGPHRNEELRYQSADLAPQSLAEQLKAQADLEQRSVSAVTRLALEDQLRKEVPRR